MRFCAAVILTQSTFAVSLEDTRAASLPRFGGGTYWPGPKGARFPSERELHDQSLLWRDVAITMSQAVHSETQLIRPILMHRRTENRYTRDSCSVFQPAYL